MVNLPFCSLAPSFSPAEHSPPASLAPARDEGRGWGGPPLSPGDSGALVFSGRSLRGLILHWVVSDLVLSPRPTDTCPPGISPGLSGCRHLKWEPGVIASDLHLTCRSPFFGPPMCFWSLGVSSDAPPSPQAPPRSLLTLTVTESFVLSHQGVSLTCGRPSHSVPPGSYGSSLSPAFVLYDPLHGATQGGPFRAPV